ncbi:MAG TPA: type IV pilin protein [Burkholderiaceae bacterium]|jgi:type IV pilus assembly protein PilE|nr:type IV pilin protein [Burkholderiaceae bacterium]
MKPKFTRGFTLIELMIVVVIVAILAAVALPSYQNSIRKSRRPDAKTALLDLAAREERYYTVNNTYTNVAANLGYAALPVNLGTGSKPDYTLSVSAFTATTFSLQALAQNDQVNDTCGSYTLDNLGNQLNIYPAGTAAAAIFGCW